jgi:hypothetical protein
MNVMLQSKKSVQLIPTGSIKYFSYSSSVYLRTSTFCQKKRTNRQRIRHNFSYDVFLLNDAPNTIHIFYLVIFCKLIVTSWLNTINNSNLNNW